ncbi:DegQ family serine endoprotease [Methylomonas rivi]|uniref:Probable periplasmic serine endoprotease DegP-like n=1 Tax=Methylomonas rivi TaxID=2952226 RepID=A0ABT1TZR2_9GAMM|nr:DegQ family serine endoprotease [Methylomonas sp. WSC-6]MBS4051706.1 DegQ family serine endoprotease [Methylomonas sp.]MCQ8127051.1 DegQ family serine endoprotease [Methylomonas sp. WSC-6]
MFNKFVNSVWLWMLMTSLAFAQLPDFTEMVKNNGDAVVNISTTQKAPELQMEPDQQQIPQDIPPELEDFFRHFFQGPGRGYVPKETNSLGSGFVISKDGYILTNHHVVNNASEIVVKLKDRRELLAKLVGSDESTDVALLKVDSKDLPVVQIGAPEQLQVGEWVLAIGTPFGFEQSVTAGIVSAKGRSLPDGNYVPFIQTDVAINPGNSGGPLFNMQGQVVGINSQIYSRSGGYMGLSFAIPIDVAMNVAEQIKVKGKVSRGWLGVQIQDVTRQLAESFGMDRPHGALVAKVIPGGPAEKAGLQVGDIIVEFDGHVIETSGELPPIVGMTPVDEKATLKIIRQGDKEDLSVKVGLLPAQAVQLAPSSMPETTVNRLGLAVADLTEEQRQQLQVEKNGVLVQKVGKGIALDAGIQPGDVILRVQNAPVKDVADFNKIVAKLPVDKSIAMLIQRNGSPVFLAFKIDK